MNLVYGLSLLLTIYITFADGVFNAFGITLMIIVVFLWEKDVARRKKKSSQHETFWTNT